VPRNTSSHVSDILTELIDGYLNGPRTLSNDRLSYLILSRPKPTEDSASVAAPVLGNDQSTEPQQYELLICATHFLADMMALHRFANDFFNLLGSEMDLHELRTVLHDEWLARWVKADNDVSLSTILGGTLKRKFVE